jgi:iron(III) transport system substrate-binding protein
VVDALAEAFDEEYDVEIAVYRASGETILPRLVEEADAGFRGADVVEMNGLGMFNLNERGLLVPYRSPSGEALVEEAEYQGWTATTLLSFAASWNTKLVEERPRSWEDLADERFRGRIAVEAGDLDWYKTLWEYWVEERGKTPAEADRLFAAMARGGGVVRGHTLLAQLMAAGEYAVAPNYATTVQRFVDDGAPIAWTPVVEPLIVQPQGVGLVHAAKHPAAAILFVDWILSDGQVIIAEHGREPVRRDLAIAAEAERRMVDFASLVADQQLWSDRFERLLALGEPVESDE